MSTAESSSPVKDPVENEVATATEETVVENIVENATADAASKRKREDEDEAPEENNDENDASKKVKVDEAPAVAKPLEFSTTTTATGQELYTMEIAQDKVGQVIGSKGMIILEIQTRSGAHAHVNQDFPDGVNRQINITGTAEQIKVAAELINKIITEGPTSIHVNSMAGGPTVTQIVECNQPTVGKIIGSGGATIKELQSRSGARIQIDQDYPPDVPRKVNITGTAAAVALGVQLVQNIIAGGPPMMGMGGGGGGGGAGMGAYGPAGGMMNGENCVDDDVVSVVVVVGGGGGVAVFLVIACIALSFLFIFN
jgi:far upstream element-binding protein